MAAVVTKAVWGEGPRALREEDLQHFKIKERVGNKVRVESVNALATVRWIGYLDGDAHVSIGYEMVRVSESLSCFDFKPPNVTVSGRGWVDDCRHWPNTDPIALQDALPLWLYF